METKQSQIKIGIPNNVKLFAQKKAKNYGLTLAGYIRHLIVDQMEREEYPVFEMSDKTKKHVELAIKNYKKGIEVKNLKEYFDKL